MFGDVDGNADHAFRLAGGVQKSLGLDAEPAQRTIRPDDAKLAVEQRPVERESAWIALRTAILRMNSSLDFRIAGRDGMGIESQQAVKATRPLHPAFSIAVPDAGPKFFFKKTKYLRRVEVALQVAQFSPPS